MYYIMGTKLRAFILIGLINLYYIHVDSSYVVRVLVTQFSSERQSVRATEGRLRNAIRYRNVR